MNDNQVIGDSKRVEECRLLGCSYLLTLVLRSRIFYTLKMEAIRSSETSVQSTTSTRRHNPEDGILHSHRRENLKSYIEKSSSRFTFVSPLITIYFFFILLNSIPGRDKRFLSTPHRPDRLRVPTSILSEGYRGPSPRE
jgi:hypothetical protein